MTSIPFGAQLIGRTEKTLNAILDRLLAGSGVSEPQWVALKVTIAGGAGPVADVSARVAGALRTTTEAGRARVGELAARGFLSPPDDGATVTVTAAGRAFHRRIAIEAGQIENRLWGALPAADLQAAGQVLNAVLQNAGAELDAQRPGAS